MAQRGTASSAAHDGEAAHPALPGRHLRSEGGAGREGMLRMHHDAPVDLHVHTTASDGTLSPAEVVQLASDAGIVALGITDHDTVAGVREAQEAGERLGVEIIPGVEISAEFSPEEMHILGYFVDPESPALLDTITWVQRSRSNRNPEIARRFNDLGIPISMEEVAGIANGGLIGRPHFAQALIARGVVKSTQEAFERYLSPGMPAYVAKVKLNAEQAIEAIHGAGGVAVLAHPQQLGIATDEQLRRLVRSLKAAGLDGIECYYSNQSHETSTRHIHLAKHFGLAVSGGSDFHGGSKPHIKLGDSGGYGVVPYHLIEGLRRRLPVR